MKITLKLIALLLVSLIYTSCGDDEPDTTQNAEGSIEMAMKVTYDGEPLVLSENYVYPDGKAMFFSRFSFFMSDLTLRTEEGAASSDASNHLRLGQAEYWPGWNSYVFCKVEGVIDFDGDGTPETDFALHLGADEALVNIELDKDFVVNDNQTTELVIPIELKNIFQNGSAIYDIESDPKTHTLSQADAIAELARNLKTCF